MRYEDKAKLLKEVTRRDADYYIDGYVDVFYERYELVKSIKEAVGAEGIKMLFDLVNSETYELMNLLEYLEN